MSSCYRYVTRSGEFRITATHTGWHAAFNGERFDGPFPSAQSAAEDIANGHSAFPSCGDPSTLGLPDDIGDWEAIRS